MTDNFNNYRDFINTVHGGLPENNEKGNLDRYFVIELIRRGKDNPELSKSNYHFKNYYIYSWADLDRYEPEIKDICNMFRLRAYGSASHKMMSQVALDTLAESARRIAAHDYKKFYNIFESCSGKFCDKSSQIWVVDVDREQLHGLDDIKGKLETCEPVGTDKVLFTMPTKSGVHLLTRPFNLNRFYQSCTSAEVKKNHLTLIYENL